MNKYKIVITTLFLICCIVIQSAMAQKTDKLVRYGATLVEKRQDADMKKFRSNRFGQFIHWGLYSIPAGCWNGKIYYGASEFLMRSANISPQIWEKLKEQFNPTLFDGEKWAKMAKEMGVKYATLTTKHHEGFCLWPSQYTDFDVENTPCQKDLVGEFIKAYNREGIDVYLYYSILDWHHPDWKYNLVSKEDSVAFNRYKLYVRNQLVELLQRYPTIKGFWFDGTWDKSWQQNGVFSYELEQELKKIHPGLIVNSRMRADEYGARHFDSNGWMMGDYESGYERRLPESTDLIVTTRDWEACMTIHETSWGYHADREKQHIKRPDELIEMLAKTVSLGGNFLLNFSPLADGTYCKREREIAQSIGKWMKINGSAIYNCDYAKLKKQDWGYYTRGIGSNKINMIVCNIPISKRLKIVLPKELRIASKVSYKQGSELVVEQLNNSTYEILLGDNDLKQEMPFVLEFEVETSKNEKDKFIEVSALI